MGGRNNDELERVLLVQGNELCSMVDVQDSRRREAGSQGEQGPHQDRPHMLSQIFLFKLFRGYRISDKVFTFL